MPFSDAFSVANPFSMNPQYSNTPQSAQSKKVKAAQIQGQTPEHAATPKAIEPDEWGGAESIAAARTSPLMSAIGGYHEQEAPSHSAMPQTAITNYSVGNVPGNAQAASKANANASYTDPLTHQTYYYYVPPSGSSQSVASNSVSSSGGSNQGVSITQNSPATGMNQLPSWIASELQSGKTSSWTNPKTGQTWYAPGVLGSAPEYQSIWLSGPGYSGPVQNYNGTLYINSGGNIIPVTTTGTTTITHDGKVIYQGSTAAAPAIEYTADGKFTGLLNVPPTSIPAAEFTNYQTFSTPSGSVSLPTSMQDGPIVETGSWAQNANGGFSFTPTSYQFSNYGTTVTLSNPTIEELESYGISAAQAQDMLQGLSGSLELTISPSTASTGSPGYTIQATPAPGSTQLINVPLPTINGATTGGVSYSPTGNPTYTQTPTLPIVYSYGSNGQATPTGFQTNEGISDTYTETVNGESYTFMLNNGNIEYAPTGSTAFAQLEFNANPNPQNAINLANIAVAQMGSTAFSPTMIPTLAQQAGSWLNQNIAMPAESALYSAGTALAPAGAAFNTYVAKPFEQYVASPAEQAASYAASQIYPALSSYPKDVSLPQVNPLMIGMLPLGLPASELASSLQPYLNNGTQDINSFLSGLQNGVNQWAATPYNPGNILSAPYWQNQIGTDIQLIEQLVGHPIKTIGAIPEEVAQVQTLANELVKEGYAPWYLPDVTLAMMAAPLVATGYGSVALTGGSLGAAGILTGIGAGANYGIGGLLQGQWTGPQAVLNAETGGLTGAILSPLTVGSPIASWLASKGITGLAGQILNNIPVYGSWSALNAGLSSEAQGKVPTPAYLGENFGLGALVGAAMPIGGRVLSSVAAKFLPNAIGYGIDDYISKFGSSPQVADYIKSVTDLGGNPNDLTFYAGKSGNIAGVMYNDMHVGYDTAQQIGQYLQQVADQNGGKVILAHTSPTSLPNSFDIQSAEETGSPLGGVRANAYRAGEGMYYNLPTEGNQPLWLSGYLGGENYAEPKFSLNPFANLKGTLLATTTTPSNIDAESLNRFFAENPGTDLSTSQGQNLLSRWLYEQAMAQGKQFGIPYQNYLPGGGEQQVMGYPGTNINMLNSQTYAFRPNEGFFAPAKFIKVGTASNLPEDMVAGAGSSAEPLTQEEYANLVRQASETSSGAYYYTPYGAIPASIASAIASRLPYAQGISLPSPSTYSAPTSALSTPYSVSPMPSVSPSIASSLYSISPSAALSSSPSVAQSVSPSVAQSSFPSISSSTSPSISSSTSPSVASSPYSSIASTSPSISYSPSSVASSPYFYPGSIRKPLDIFPPLKGSQWFAPQKVMAENPYEAYASIYSPSLLPEVMPELESLAEQEYSPMTALSTIRPLRAPSVNTPITLPSYATPTQPTIAEENLPGASNYYRAQSTPMAHVISGPSPTAATMATTPTATATPSYSFNEPFSNAPAATQVAPITDPAILQAISTAANPLSLGTLPANAPPSAYSVIANPMLQSLNRLNMNALRLPTSTLPNQLNSQTMAMNATSPNAAAPAFGFAGYSSPRIGNISLIPTSQDIMSVLGPEQMLRLLNQINPTKFSVTNIQYAPRAALAEALNNLSYSDIVLLMSRMSVPQRMMVYGLLGIPPGEALIIAESGTQGLFIPSLSNALAATTRKRIAMPSLPTPQNAALPGQPQMPSMLPTFNQMNLAQSRPALNINRQLVTI
ncbi:hypothetical protein M1367_00030 [Candidatus Marsarchaeota archaeon]|nr:hypothetical protein [Candidatus Marsarchaeota archaeon]